VEVRHQEHLAAVRGKAFVFLLWHDALLPLLWHHRGEGVVILVSEARDGRYLAEYGRHLGYREVTGSSTRGGVRALLGAVNALEGGIPVAVTPDGPQGPRRELKPGVLVAAQKAGVPVLPIHAGASRAWRLRSWDRFMIPKPFARVLICYGPPFLVAPGEVGLNAALPRAQAAMAALEQEIPWADAEPHTA
jgi:lysophospholipid acyltransferase (LPLAT)-like uncharacterized protein